MLNAATERKHLVDIFPAQEDATLRSKQKQERISINVRFSAAKGEIPEELLEDLNAVLKAINEHTDVKASGFNK